MGRGVSTKKGKRIPRLLNPSPLVTPNTWWQGKLLQWGESESSRETPCTFLKHFLCPTDKPRPLLLWLWRLSEAISSPHSSVKFFPCYSIWSVNSKDNPGNCSFTKPRELLRASGWAVPEIMATWFSEVTSPPERRKQRCSADHRLGAEALVWLHGCGTVRAAQTVMDGRW